MPVNQIIPIYIVAGFLDSGKTTLIHNMIDDESFSRGQKTLLVVCEDGEEEYDAEKLAKQKVTLHMVDSVEDMTPSLFVDLNKQYKPERVIIEYNNTFTFAKLDTMQLPPKWELVQVIDMVDATTFDSYMNNMRQLMTDPMQNADLILCHLLCFMARSCRRQALTFISFSQRLNRIRSAFCMGSVISWRILFM